MARDLPAGWYADPADADRYRYWTGTQWTTDVRDRHAVDVAAAACRPLPDFDAPDPGASAPDSRRTRSLPVLLAVLGLVALVATAGVVTTGQASGPPGRTLSGEIRVPIAAARAAGPGTHAFAGDDTRCGTGADGGIGTGTEVAVSNGRGRTLGVADLGAGRLDRTLTSAACVFTYEITGVADAGVYEVRVADRTPRRVTRDQVEAAGGRVDLRLG